jgi:hypothetical protein
MKIPLLCISIASLSFTACAAPPAAKMTVKVLNAETGTPMSNCVVKTRFLVKSHWNEPDEYDEQKCISDADGTCVFSGVDNSFGYGGSVLASNYYQSSFNVPYTGMNRALDRWEPWNPTIEVKMRPKKNPVPMVYKKIFRIKPPVVEQPVGFDLVRADWVAPHGSGIQSDFIFTVTLSEVPKRGAKYTLGFSSETDGIQEYLPPYEYASSSFKWPYEAPLDGYKSSLSRFAYYQFPNPELPGSDRKSPINYMFRVRSRKLDNGEISGSYGFIQGEIKIEKENALCFEYWFNPVPNERSLEYNGENLIRK